jgi:DNA polymerase-4
LFGRRGRLLHDQAQGIDHRLVTVRPAPRATSRRTSFDPPNADPVFLQAMIDYLIERAVSWVRFHGLMTRGIVVSIRYGDYQAAETRARLAGATDQEREVREAARDRFLHVYQRRLPLRLVAIELAALVPRDEQSTFFPDPAAARARRLAECKDSIRRRFGFLSLLSGSALELGRIDRDRENFRMRTPCLTR